MALALLGITKFETDAQGKKILTAKQEETLTGKLEASEIQKLKDLLAQEDDSEVKLAEAVVAQKAAEKERDELSAQLKALGDDPQGLITGLQSQLDAKKTEIANLTNTINLLKDESVEDPYPKGNSAMKNFVHGPKATHLFGASGMGFMLIDDSRPYNQRALAAILAVQGIVIAAPAFNATTDFTQLATDFDQYIKLSRTDIRTLPMPSSQFDSIFPVRSGISDKAVGFNMFIDELSQAAQDGFVSKGGFQFAPEQQEVKDIEFMYSVTKMKELERNWIGMLTGAASNSNPIKLSFVAFLMEKIVMKLIMEKDQRTSNGYYVAPTANVAGLAINGVDGVYKVLNDKIAERKIKVFPISNVNDSNIVDKLKEMAALLPSWVRDSGLVIFYLPTGYLRKYNDNLVDIYGATYPNPTDKTTLHGYASIELQEIPMSEGRGRIFATIRGNVERLENLPGEMISGMTLTLKEKSVSLVSSWKEGQFFNFVGKKAANDEELAARGYDQQVVWCTEDDYASDFFIDMVKDDATPSVAQHLNIQTVENTNSMAITDITDAPVGKLIKIRNRHATKGVTIADSGTFAGINGNWNPAAGDEIHLMKNSAGAFFEIRRTSSLSGYTQLAADATTISAATSKLFLTGTNTAATAITNITGSIEGEIIEIRGNGGTPNATTIANSGNFSIGSAITLTTGVWIRVTKGADGKFYQVERSA